jgi:hypothetical protein
MKPSGIDPATFRFVARCLNHRAIACPRRLCGLWKNTVVRDGPQMTIWRMLILCCTPKASNTEYVILIGFPLQLWLHEGTSLLRHTYIAGLACCYRNVGRMHKVLMFFLEHEKPFFLTVCVSSFIFYHDSTAHSGRRPHDHTQTHRTR